MSLVWMGSYDGGTLMPADEARVSPFDHGFTVADGVFETLKVVNGRPFALTRHLARLGTSCVGLGLAHPNHAVIREAVEVLLASSDPTPLARLRITVTGGDGPLGSDRGTAPATVVVAASPIAPWPATTTVVTVPWPRNERSALVGVKSTSYAENVHALAHAHSLGASEAIFGNTVGQLCEGTGTNIFVVIAGEIVTPTLSSGCLPGITRALICEWANVREADLPLEVLSTADEIFLASSTRDVHPVTRVDDRSLPTGSITAKVASTFARESTANIDP
jgi:branched-chain amino acid aminotransferase